MSQEQASHPAKAGGASSGKEDVAKQALISFEEFVKTKLSDESMKKTELANHELDTKQIRKKSRSRKERTYSAPFEVVPYVEEPFSHLYIQQI